MRFPRRTRSSQPTVDGMDPTALMPSGTEALYRKPRVRSALARHFNRLYYAWIESTTLPNRFLGHTTLKYPTDLWIYQELLAELRPAVLVETGTFRGGSALYFATLMDALAHGKVVTVDVEEQPGLPEHPRISYVVGSSVDPEITQRVYAEIDDAEPVLVILDSDHACDHVLRELHAYADLVGPGSYLIVEDTNINGRPVLSSWGPGPGEAVERFLAARDDFQIDRSRERMMLTANPEGFLKRVR